MLLDSNKLTQDLQEHCKSVSCVCKSELLKEVYELAYQHVIEFIEIQPAAYDVESVLNQIDEITEPVRPVGWSRKIEIVEARAVKDIVRAGGGINATN